MYTFANTPAWARHSSSLCVLPSSPLVIYPVLILYLMCGHGVALTTRSCHFRSLHALAFFPFLLCRFCFQLRARHWRSPRDVSLLAEVFPLQSPFSRLHPRLSSPVALGARMRPRRLGFSLLALLWSFSPPFDDSRLRR